jgi:two-component system chemotaxis response regulator CheB
MPTTIKVLVVDDSALIRQMLTRALGMDPRIDIVASAKDGVEAIEKARELRPDVVTLDIEMPQLTGLEALPHIRKHTDARVVMLSALDDPETTYQALALGAVDFIPKPSGGMASSMTELADVLLKTIKTAYRITPEKAAEALAAATLRFEGVRTQKAADSAVPPSAFVFVAASTGGPPALERVMSGLDGSMPATYVLVQHLPAGFADSLSKRLDAVSSIDVRMASEGDVLSAGHAYLAPHGAHVSVEPEGNTGKLVFTKDAPMHGVRPAADKLFESAARVFKERSVGVVLTGMGSDGARGALAIKQAGGDAILQDEHTSVVWGMPGAAMRMGASGRAVPLQNVAAEIRRAVRLRSMEEVPGA